MDLYDAFTIGLKIAFPLSFIILIAGIVFFFYNKIAGIITIISAIPLIILSIISIKWYKKDKEDYLKFRINILVWRSFAILIFCFFFFFFLTLSSFYSADMEGVKMFAILSLIFLLLSIFIGWHSRIMK